MSNTSESHKPDSGTTRIVAGETAPKPKRRRTLEIGLAVGLVLLIGAGAAVASAVSQNNQAAPAPTTTPAAELKLGYFSNVTHGPALVGTSKGLIAKELGETKLSTQVFNAGPAAIEALNAGAIDATYIGPNPAINSFVKSKGESISIIAGAASGGAQLVVKPEINSAADLKGKILSSPQLGGTQDVALRAWLGDQGFKTNTDGSGDVNINPTENAQSLKLFQDGKLDGAWLPEPWASRLVLEAGAKVLVDEKDLWENGDFTTTILIVNKKFAAEHPETVKALLKGHVESVNWLNSASAEEKATTINAVLKDTAGKPLPANVIERALQNIKFTTDPLAGTYNKLLEDGVKAGTTQQADINGIFDLRTLNEVEGKKTSAAGLGQD
ncbi:NitT/TauT family transport system substrate-binding protein [Pseudarthrobacter sp. PvP004]|jgi:NitT/TauT family transport system substrate-binding protein|uniref:ABC transporter, substrate-binding protein, aliphatic sulfonates family n=1 Tax=Paenarthrobacter aurescens (strain TC1) TaxID=290340 RepID=A1R977_PAEAT|nr:MULTISPECIES: ABC transporter substrate-binding protein [Micrococcaceae]ABM07959.1 putative ABC transporter, substrate-binding protein, aliphatic sulfonates family [Paenarthrobacter aurescens TC1]MBP2264807.1 NitT/TauT family transport system substrate-binding protein [Pseudarthrobacter sp. PvP004]